MEEKYTLFKRKQFRLSTIPTGRNIIALLLLIQIVYTQLELLETNKIYDMVLRSEGNALINPNGEISPLKLHLMYKCGYMQNLRKYLACIIDTESIHAKSKPPKRSIYSLYLLNSTHEDSDKTKYLKEFNRQLVNMFPSEEGQMSIESESYDSFTRFLREYKDTKDVFYVLASLFLLSEKVKIPIEVVNDPDKGNMLVLKKETSEASKLRVEMFMTILDKNRAPVYQKKTEDIVNFFKNVVYESSLKIPEEFSSYYNAKDLSKGSFLFNPRFLIQSYIFEYIDDTCKYMKFVKAIYELLNEKMPTNRRYPSTVPGKRVSNAYFSMFMEHEMRTSIKTIEYIHAIANIEKVCNDLYSQMPSVHKEVHSMHYPIPSYIRRKDKNIVTENNYIVHLLFDLFVCFTFNQYTNRQTTSHLPSPSSHLVEFFDKNKRKIQSEDSTLRSDWCKMVSDNLSAENVFYTEEKKQIEFGLLNMLYAIKGLAGTNKELEVAINCLDNIIKRKSIEESDQAEIKESLQKVFKSLSLNKSIEVECENLKLIKTESGRVDIFTDENTSIVVSYSEHSFHSYRRLEIEMPHFIFDFTVVPTIPPVLNTVDFNSINTQLCKAPVPKDEEDECIKWHIEQYLDIQNNRIAHAMEKEYTFTNKIALALNNSGYNTIPVTLLLSGDLNFIEYKAKIVEVFLIHSSTETLDITNPMVKFTSKLIDSVPLDDPRVRKIMLRGCLYSTKYKKYYPQIKYSVEEILDLLMKPIDATSIISLVDPLFSGYVPSLSIASSFALVASFLKKYKSSKERYIAFGSKYLFIKITKTLTPYTNREACFKSIIATIRSCTDATGDYCADNIFMGWIFHLEYIKNGIPLPFFKYFYNSIEYKNINQNVKMLLNPDSIECTLKNSISILNKNKAHIFDAKNDLGFRVIKYRKLLTFIKDLSK
ncbi:hypothetical protein NEIRO03_1779 [Nematocida sp. AWRm78]|nr:hypothetical protein NEIRO02_1647 [Nematocida sp. AWRm79]KAI5184651.1 hypothetical protein NEIRO03_1779 [Nematocida sp. AWRm78]